MKDFIKDYGAVFGPIMAFGLGVIAIYIKFFIDKNLEISRSNKKLLKLIEMIEQSAPPRKYYKIKVNNTFSADHARNLTNISIFGKRLNVLKSIVEKIEGEVLVNCSIPKVQQFHHIKFIFEYMHIKVELIKTKKDNNTTVENLFSYNDISEADFYELQEDYKRLLRVCENPEGDFKYIED